jgi:hypothetical protein
MRSATPATSSQQRRLSPSLSTPATTPPSRSRSALSSTPNRKQCSSTFSVRSPRFLRGVPQTCLAYRGKSLSTHWIPELEDKFYGFELNHVARRYDETADELAKIASARTTVPPNVFSRDLYQPSVKTYDTPEAEKVSALPEAPSAQPEAPSAPEGEALRVEGKQNGVPPNRDWQTPCLQYLHRGELPLDRAEARRLTQRAKSFILLGDGKELYHRSPSGILQRCISIAEGQKLLQENTLGGLRSSRSASSPCWKRSPTRFLLADHGGRRQ